VALTRREDIVTQAELRKDAEFSTNRSSAARLVRELYLNALARRITTGAAVESGPLTFDPISKSICVRKQPASAARASNRAESA
jgi:hypothetical protein